MAKRVYWWITDAGRRALRDAENSDFLAEHPEYIGIVKIVPASAFHIDRRAYDQAAHDALGPMLEF